MPNSTNYIAMAGLALAVVAMAVLIYHMYAMRVALGGVRRRLDTQDGLIGGGAGGAAERLKSLEAGMASNQSALERASGRLAELEVLAKTDVSRVGFVRYDAFEDTGSDLSYALALLNREGDGVVLSSIYSRTDTRTYGKAVKAFAPAANASDEELRAIELARNSAS